MSRRSKRQSASRRQEDQPPPTTAPPPTTTPTHNNSNTVVKQPAPVTISTGLRRSRRRRGSETTPKSYNLVSSIRSTARNRHRPTNGRQHDQRFYTAKQRQVTISDKKAESVRSPLTPIGRRRLLDDIETSPAPGLASRNQSRRGDNDINPANDDDREEVIFPPSYFQDVPATPLNPSYCQPVGTNSAPVDDQRRTCYCDAADWDVYPNDKGVQCDGCSQWFHQHCTGIMPTEDDGLETLYGLKLETEDPWYCVMTDMSSFSSSSDVLSDRYFLVKALTLLLLRFLLFEEPFIDIVIAGCSSLLFRLLHYS